MIKLFKRKKKDGSEDLQKLLENYDLPSFSEVIMNTLNLLRDPDSSVQEISRQVEGDPGLHVKVLRTVNSVAFGLVSKVQNINHAISLLGNVRLEALVLSLAVQDTLPVRSVYLDTERFWRISTIRASLAKKLAQRLHPATAVESFAAGLLQDMAVPVLAEVHGKSYNDVLEKWENDQGSQLTELEMEHFGYDHAMAGSLMAQKWNLPRHITAAITGHHSESDKDIDPAVRLVSQIKYDMTDELDEFREACITKYNLDEATLSDYIQNAFNDSGELL